MSDHNKQNTKYKTLRKSLNPAFLKQKPTREEVDRFDQQLAQMLANCQEKESEEYHKNLVIELFKRRFDQSCFINTKGRNDLVIHNGAKNSDSVGVMIEAKRPTNRAEMPTVHNLNAKATQELLLYFLRERFNAGKNNLELKHLIITNVYEWFVLDAQVFERCFAQDKKLVKQFQDFEQKQLVGDKTDFFYQEIASPAIEAVADQLEFTRFDLRDSKTRADHIALFKFFSSQHLLKQNVANDSNTLDKGFYNELLHLIGLTEVKEGGKKLIQRLPQPQRNPASLLENTITQLKEREKLSQQDQADGGFDTALELVITWVNRVLFLKLLEAQLMSYHKDNERDYAFLNSQKIADYYQLNRLFFQVLAKKTNERNANVSAFVRVPYLNSSLFEESALEKDAFSIDALDAHQSLPLHNQTVLKDTQGKRRQGSLPTLAYLFEFLEAYDFSSEGAEDFAQEQKTLINASVLGLIFEKINGYRDGSFFTPGFITMYMCRETLRRAVVQKFNEVKGWDCQTFDELYDQIGNTKEDRNEANIIINSLKICDPAVGSGHFLVSALNELIAIKHELKILQSADGKRLKEYSFEVHNDELVVMDEDGKLFQYKPNHPESQRVQQTLFHEKQTLIERCLFGVDINPNSVKICRLRLWIELLKNAYYKTGTNELETLPNIDINIKSGNSLVSRFKLNADLKQALNKSQWDIETYQHAVKAYQNAKDKQAKREAQELIDKIQGEFQQEMFAEHWKQKDLNDKRAELDALTQQDELFERTDKQQAAWEKQVKQKLSQIAELEAELHDLKEGVLYQNAFEWRYEFPDVLNAAGDFVGFDVVIGNPPYIRQEEIKDLKGFLKERFERLYVGTADIYIFFIEQGFLLLKPSGLFTFIMPNKFMQAGYGEKTRQFLLEQNLVNVVDFGDVQIFDEATTYPCVLLASKEPPSHQFFTTKIEKIESVDGFSDYVKERSHLISHQSLSAETWVISKSADQNLLKKIAGCSTQLGKYINGSAKYGIKTGLSEAFLIDNETKQQIEQADPKSINLIKPVLRGRDLSKWFSYHIDSWLIATFPALRLKIEEYVGIHDYLKKFGVEKLEQTGKKGARKKTSYAWFETQDSIAYWSEFQKPKIMYQVFQVKPCFIYDETGLFCNNSMWFIPSDDKVLLAILNSKMGWWLISKYCTKIQNGYQLIWKYFEQIPIVKADQTNQKLRDDLTHLVSQILEAKQTNPNADTQDLEHKIDQLVYQLYGLTPEEIALVEAQVGR